MIVAAALAFVAVQRSCRVCSAASPVPNCFECKQVALAGARSFQQLLGEAGSHPLGYLHAPDAGEDVQAITHWIVADVSTQASPETSSRLYNSCACIVLPATPWATCTRLMLQMSSGHHSLDRG